MTEITEKDVKTAISIPYSQEGKGKMNIRSEKQRY